MPQEREGSSWSGGNGKKALESEASVLPAYGFLIDLGISGSEIVTMAEVQMNEHPLSRIWIGTGIEVRDLSEELILKAKGTGCLEVAEGQKRVATFIKEGVVLETKGPNSVDPRQSRMDLNL